MLDTPSQVESRADAPSRCAAMHKALGDRSRLEFVLLLASGPASVRDLVQRTGLERSLVGYHLRCLHRAGVLACVHAGKFSIYRLGDHTSIALSGERLLINVECDGVRLASELPRAAFAWIEFNPRPLVCPAPSA